ncbi:MAG: OmpH family outer membrane protein [Nitrospinae bacterium]|nr:OmpH family outer membrane protein [Nitrospinota bacterium]MZH03934.1 OmpH family outer membrane protein [Nitrospinota bacterium]MZH13878.1 OmpH family outer membrane protein [Nitrospinota bacterium]
MQLFSFKPYNFYFLLFFVGQFFFGPLAASSFAAESRVGFIDVQKAVISTKEWKKQFEIFKKDFAKEKKKIKAREKRIKKMLEDLNKQSFVLDPELKKKKEDQFRKEKVAFERYVQDQNTEFGKNEQEMTQKILLKMMKVIRKIGKEKKYTMILEQKAVLYHDKGNDLTTLATKTYDRSNK